VLDWESRETTGRQRLALVRELLSIRAREIVPRLAGARFGDARAADNGLLTADWRLGDGATLRLTANLSKTTIIQTLHETKGISIWGSPPDDVIKPWAVFWSLEAR